MRPKGYSSLPTFASLDTAMLFQEVSLEAVEQREEMAP